MRHSFLAITQFACFLSFFLLHFQFTAAPSQSLQMGDCVIKYEKLEAYKVSICVLCPPLAHTRTPFTFTLIPTNTNARTHKLPNTNNVNVLKHSFKLTFVTFRCSRSLSLIYNSADAAAKAALMQKNYYTHECWNATFPAGRITYR